jgi:hypothetical protein
LEHWFARLGIASRALPFFRSDSFLKSGYETPYPFCRVRFGLQIGPGGQATNGAPIPKGWYKGNLHTHTLWSDGDDYPEMVVNWYKSHGYQFLALSDHNILLAGEKWVEVRTNI